MPQETMRLFAANLFRCRCRSPAIFCLSRNLRPSSNFAPGAITPSNLRFYRHSAASKRTSNNADTYVSPRTLFNGRKLCRGNPNCGSNSKLDQLCSNFVIPNFRSASATFSGPNSSTLRHKSSSANRQERRKLRNDLQKLLDARKIKIHLEKHSEKAKQKLLERTAELRENIMTIPNGLCVLRISLAPVIGYLVLMEHYGVALGTFVIAGVTDLLDGWIARRYPSQQSLLGSALDPLADKLLVAILFLSLTYTGLIPVPLTALVIARDVGLVGAAFYVRYKTLSPPFTLFRFFDVSTVSARVRPTAISKVNTAIQLAFVATTLAAPVFNYADSSFLHALWYLTGGTTVWSGLSYLYSSNTFELIRKTKTKPRIPRYFHQHRRNGNSRK